jgi:hypothetical protein
MEIDELKNVGDSSRIIHFMQKASLLDHITYGAELLSKEQTFCFIPEVERIDKLFNRNSSIQWRIAMDEHNKILARGNRLSPGPLKRVALTNFSSLDLFMIQMHSAALSDALVALTLFAERVIPQIYQNPNAVMWHITGPLFITRDRWYRLARQVMTVLDLLGFPGHYSCPDSTPPLSPWPDFERLKKSAARAYDAFLQFDCRAHRSNTILSNANQ